MQFPTVLLNFVLLGLTAVNAAPAADHAEASIEKRGFGCNAVFPDDPDICHFHCVNEVSTDCDDGSQITPVDGICGGVGTYACQCIYDVNCP